MAKKRKVRQSKPSMYEQMARASSRHARVNHKSNRKVTKPSEVVSIEYSEDECNQLLQLIASREVKPWRVNQVSP